MGTVRNVELKAGLREALRQIGDDPNQVVEVPIGDVGLLGNKQAMVSVRVVMKNKGDTLRELAAKQGAEFATQRISDARKRIEKAECSCEALCLKACELDASAEEAEYINKILHTAIDKMTAVISETKKDQEPEKVEPPVVDPPTEHSEGSGDQPDATTNGNATTEASAKGTPEPSVQL